MDVPTLRGVDFLDILVLGAHVLVLKFLEGLIGSIVTRPSGKPMHIDRSSSGFLAERRFLWGPSQQGGLATLLDFGTGLVAGVYSLDRPSGGSLGCPHCKVGPLDSKSGMPCCHCLPQALVLRHQTIPNYFVPS